MLASIERSDVEVFGGRVQNSSIMFGRRGAPMNVEGYEYAIMLQDYLTPSQSLVNQATAAALATIIENTGFNISTEGAFGYISLLETWNTWLEMVTQIELWSDTTVELDLDEIEIDDVVNAGTWTGCNAGLKSCFFYDGVTQRFYVFAKNNLNDLYYYHSLDGDTWTGVDTTYNPSGDYWSVAWYNDKVYLFIYDGVNTDFYRGTINDGNGAINFVLIAGNIFANEIIFGPVWDDQGDMWVLRNNGGGQAYESINDGVAWNFRFGPGVTSLHGILPQGSDGDMWGFVLDAPNTDLEEWLWDRNLGSFTFQAKIEDEDAVDEFDGCSDAAYNWYIIWIDTNDECWMATDNGGIASDVIDDTSAVLRTPTASCDGYFAYFGYVDTTGTVIVKYFEDDLQDTYSTNTWGQPNFMSSPRTYLQDGQIAVFFVPIDTVTDDPYFVAFTQVGIRLVIGAATGYFRTNSVTCHGTATQWGLLTSENVEIDDDWEILDAGNVTRVDNVTTPYDLHYEGALSIAAYPTVKVYCDLIDTGIDPYIYAFDISDRIDEVTLDIDYEDCYSAVTRLADLAGADFWVEKDNGTYTLYFSTQRGDDKTVHVILKNSRTGDEADTQPNIKFIEKTFDWDSYANSIKVIGGTVGATRIEADLQDHTAITDLGAEVWKTLRDADILTEAMARQKAAVELQRRKSVVLRISGDFVDKYDTNDISIGDTVTLIAEWPDADLKIEGSHRVVGLRRSYGVDGEQVSARFSNQLKSSEYWAYMGKTADLERWATT